MTEVDIVTKWIELGKICCVSLDVRNGLHNET